jgi:hypothetical protein
VIGALSAGSNNYTPAPVEPRRRIDYDEDDFDDDLYDELDDDFDDF